MRPGETARTARFGVRTDPRTLSMIRDAAAVGQRSLSSFVVEAARERAQEVLGSQEQTTINHDEFARVLEELDAPARVSASLLAAIERSLAEGAR